MATKQVKLKEIAYASNLKSRALSVLIYLIDRSNQELTCFPAIPTMAEQLHISISTVKRALRELVEAGYICKDARYREKNRGQSSNIEEKKKDCPENGECLGQALESSFDSNGKAGKEVAILKTASKEEDTEHISFDSILRKKRKVGECLLEGCPLGTSKAVLKQDTSNIQRNLGGSDPKYCVYGGCNFISSVYCDRSKQSTNVICIEFPALSVNGGGGQFEIPLNYPIKI